MRTFFTPLSRLLPVLALTLAFGGCRDSSPPAAVQAADPTVTAQNNAAHEAQPPRENVSHDEDTDLPHGEDDDAQAVVDAINAQIETDIENHEIWTESQPPVIVELKRLYDYGLEDYQVTLRSRADHLEIRDFSLNRGNCGHSHTQKVNVPLEMPFHLRFGDARRARVLCNQVIEMSVLTNYGNFTFTF